MVWTPGGALRGSDAAYDPDSNVFLLVIANGPVYGIFVDASGHAVSSGFTIAPSSGGYGAFPRVRYSPDVPNGIGGTGGFLVTWNYYVGTVNYVYARLISYDLASHLVAPAQRVSAGEQGGSWQETGPPVAYSATSHKFLVAWRTGQYGVVARFVDTNGMPLASVFALENPGGSRDPGLAWNPATDEFGLITTGFTSTSAYAAFRRVRASDGVVSARTTFGVSAGTFSTDIAVNSANQYIAVWSLHPGTMSATFNQAGTFLGSRLVNGSIGYDQAMGLAYNPVSGTFLAVSNMSTTLEVGAVEMNATGVPDSQLLTATNGAKSGTFYPRVASGGNAWNIVYSRDFSGPADQIVTTSSTGGGTSGATGGTTSGGCTTASPGTGWTCVNGGWVPPPTSGGSTCTTVKPGANWTCVNGGWVPSTSTTTTSGSCTTASPGTGWTCVNGGWIPPTSTSGGSTCTTVKPGANWTCVNGGWVPSTSTTTSSCTTPSPGTGWTCVNGGWLPPTTTSGSTCTTVKPGTNWTCVNGGWIPN